MESVILVIHLFLALAIIGLVLLQRSEGGGLGIGGGGGGGGGLGNLATASGTASFLTRATGICAAAFFCTSLALGIMAGSHSAAKDGILAGINDPAAVESVLDDAAAPIEIPDAPNSEEGDIDVDAVIPVAPIAE